MRKRTAVVADDITGANDIGGMFAKSGYIAGVFPYSDALGPADFEGLDTVILDTDSRFDTPGEAYDKVLRATRLLQKTGFDLYFNKTCSVFRGNIGAEFDAMQDALGASCSMVVLGFPENGRTTLHGVHYLNGVRLDESSFRNDPIHPTTESELRRILAKQSNRKSVIFPYEWLELSKQEQAVRLDELKRENAYILFDVRDRKDLAVIARLVQDEPNLCGSSAIGRELPLVWGQEGVIPSAPVHSVRDVNGPLVLAGSLTPQTCAQVEYLRAMGVAAGRLDTLSLFEQAARAEKIRQLAEAAAACISGGSPYLIDTDRLPEKIARTKQAGYTHGMNDEAVGRLISETLGEITRQVREKTGFQKLVVAGGDTSATISRRLGVRKMVILREIEPGIPTMLSSDDCGELLLVLKSGSFGSNAFLEKACMALWDLQHGDGEWRSNLV